MSLVGNTVMAYTNAGRRMVLMMNPFERTRSRYSRRMTNQVLRILHLPVLLVVHGIDEDLFERRFGELEAVHAGAGDQLLEQLLRIGAGLELQLGVISPVMERL